MVEMVDPDFGDTVYDPTCGTAGFLIDIDVVDNILAKYSEEPQKVPIYGEEWLEKGRQTIEQAIPNLQTFRKGPPAPVAHRAGAACIAVPVNVSPLTVSAIQSTRRGGSVELLSRAMNPVSVSPDPMV
jgi:hypothetical protein